MSISCKYNIERQENSLNNSVRKRVLNAAAIMVDYYRYSLIVCDISQYQRRRFYDICSVFDDMGIWHGKMARDGRDIWHFTGHWHCTIYPLYPHSWFNWNWRACCNGNYAENLQYYTLPLYKPTILHPTTL